ncbi:50S ribosomal protein L11 methyltransferase [Sandaracinobacter sp. RS1-74]|uniref:50S ribosomal protein L11 methyltransferase n=1 Tax=Sandaracinobacteroides sayramensis TaxID=2913411 RepID=UPI001EDA16D7|nr:50S ribosomal protein L11 methyltransferase [Sandaracinobacteroides sayramensis]MCG2841587.1 50S ribosomal protein L11 methyltransferase [Sandaracinobacteroides sayramensis]
MLATLPCTRAEADAAALMDEPFPGFDPAPTLAAAEDGESWELRLYFEGEADPDMLAAFQALAPSSGLAPLVGPVPDLDWVTLSQAGLEPVSIGRFHVHTGERAGSARPGQWPIRIDAGLAFGTGQHATTAGCVAMATRLSRVAAKRNVLDVGTGSGLLAFAAHKLFPQARLTAADLDPVAVKVAVENARLNAVPLGRGRGAIALLPAPGVEHPLIGARAPYDLVFANILAGPLVALAPSLSAVVARGGHLILAGLLQPQAAKVIAAYRAQGLRLVDRSPRAEWPVLLFRKEKPANRRAAMRGARRETAGRGWQIDSL